MTSTLKNKKIRVLYLDDEENNLRSFKAAFRREYDVYTADTSEKAFDIVKSIKPQVIFSDQRMPVTSGVEFFNAVRQVFPDPVRILITGYTDINDIIEAINKGHIYRYITKPWNENEIRVAIENAYDLYTTRRTLAQKVEELEKSNHELSSFIYRSSHDLRAPVASALGLIQVARHEVKDEVALEYLEKIEGSADGLDVLVSNIIDFYKNSRQEEVLEEIDFKEIIEDVLERLTGSMRNLPADFDLDIEQGNRFKGDSFRVRIVLSNIISNAMKFKRKEQEKAQVSIKIRTDLNEAEIQVEDKGSGIIKEHLQKIFSIFFKANHQQSGSGIGLYVVKEALEKMGGSVDVESEPNKGTSVSIKIPNQV